jgi:hypothetical protein
VLGAGVVAVGLQLAVGIFFDHSQGDVIQLGRVLDVHHGIEMLFDGSLAVVGGSGDGDWLVRRGLTTGSTADNRDRSSS